jgi:acyl-CoA hydrolase
MVVGVRVESENITTGVKKHCNSSYFTMVAQDQEGKNKAVPGLLVENSEGVRRFTRSMIRRAQAFDRDSKFGQDTFKLRAHIEHLAGENVKIDLK